jgi:hypothetical protein
MIASANDKLELQTNAKRDSIVVLFALGFVSTQNTKAQLTKTPVTETASAVRRMVDVYVQSIVDDLIRLLLQNYG